MLCMEHFETIFTSAIRMAQKSVHDLGYPCDYKYLAAHELKHAPCLNNYLYTAVYVTPKDSTMHKVSVQLEVDVKGDPRNWVVRKRLVLDGDETVLIDETTVAA